MFCIWHFILKPGVCFVHYKEFLPCPNFYHAAPHTFVLYPQVLSQLLTDLVLVRVGGNWDKVGHPAPGHM